MLLKRIRKGNHHTDSELVAALDIGTSKICCAIARIEPDFLRVIGVGNQVSKGIRGGSVIDMQDVELSVLNSVHLAEQMAQESIRDVYINLSGCQSQSIGVELHVSGHSVDDADVRKLLALTRQIADPPGQEPIHAIPTSYDIDGRRGIRDPRGMYGDTLGVNVNTIYSSTSNLRNLSTCISRCHLEAKSFVSTSFASGLSALVEDEMDLGVIVIDMGAGTTTIGVFFEGNIVHTDCLPIGGYHVTSDIARVLSTPIVQAERLKALYGSALTSTADEREIVKVPQIGEIHDHTSNQIAKADLVRIIRPRIEETFELVKKRLVAGGIDKRVGNRVVLTGGASQLSGVQEVAGAILGKQVRLGRPMQTQGLHKTMTGPAFSACAGLLTFAHMEQNEHIMAFQFAQNSNSVVGRFGQWIRENI